MGRAKRIRKGRLRRRWSLTKAEWANWDVQMKRYTLGVMNRARKRISPVGAAKLRERRAKVNEQT